MQPLLTFQPDHSWFLDVCSFWVTFFPLNVLLQYPLKGWFDWALCYEGFHDMLNVRLSLVFFQFLLGLTAMMQYPFAVTVCGDLLLLRWNVPCCDSQYELSGNVTQYLWHVAWGMQQLLSKGDRHLFLGSSASNPDCSGANVLTCVWLIWIIVHNIQGTVEYCLSYLLSVAVQVHEVLHVLVDELFQYVQRGLWQWCLNISAWTI